MRDLDRIKEKVVIRLDNRQVAMAIVGFIVVSIGTFAGGVVVGKTMTDGMPGSLTEVVDGAELDSAEDHRSRSLLLARIAPGTRQVHANLSGPPPKLVASTPTEAARIETHRQIARARAGGTTRSLGPVAVGPLRSGSTTADAAPLTLVDRNPDRERAALEVPEVKSSFALQVSAFSTAGPAQVVAQQLQGTGHDARVRAVAGEDGQPLFRVEVGHFADAKQATRFQRTFERASGYSTVMVPVN